MYHSQRTCPMGHYWACHNGQPFNRNVPKNQHRETVFTVQALLYKNVLCVFDNFPVNLSFTKSIYTDPSPYSFTIYASAFDFVCLCAVPDIFIINNNNKNFSSLRQVWTVTRTPVLVTARWRHASPPGLAVTWSKALRSLDTSSMRKLR